MDTVPTVEVVATKLKDNNTHDIWGRLCGILRKVRKPKDNLTKEQRMSLEELKRIEEIMILPEDKGMVADLMTENSGDQNVWNIEEGFHLKN